MIGPAVELPTTTAPLPLPPVETLDQADKRPQAAVEQASSSAEHQAVAQDNNTASPIRTVPGASPLPGLTWYYAGV